MRFTQKISFAILILSCLALPLQLKAAADKHKSHHHQMADGAASNKAPAEQTQEQSPTTEQAQAPEAVVEGESWTNKLLETVKQNDLHFRDENDQAFDFSNIKDKRLVVTMSYTECKKYCPIVTMTKLKEIQKTLEKKGQTAEFILVTMDPETDTPKVISQYKAEKGLTFPNWHFLTGSEKDVRAFSKLVGLSGYWKMDDHILHSIGIYLILPTGQISQKLDWNHRDVEWNKFLH
jgi:cytochrome oxidase Cu insertion factor (SCO1/SenC/PrrC family)